MDIPFTQTKSWQKLQDDLNETSFFAATEGYQYLAIKKSTPVGSYLYLPYGPAARNQAGFDQAISDLKKLAREQHAIFIRIEPQNTVFKLPKSAVKTKNLSPEATWCLDLTPDTAALISGFAQGTRTRFNTYSKKGIVVETTRDLSQIQHLTQLQTKLFKQKHLTAYAENYLKTELAQPFATLYLAKYVAKNDQTRAAQTASANPAIKDPTAKDPATQNPTTQPADGQILAASLFFDDPATGTRYYMQSAADPDFKKLPATVALLTTALFDAKSSGLTTFDFWGIAPDGAPQDHPWAGFTTFKKSFGGYAKYYHGTYDLPLKATKYKLYQFLRKIRP